MATAELFKLRAHRTPSVLAALLMAALLAPSVVLIWYRPADPAAYSDVFIGTYSIVSLLLAIVFGGWLLGTEYRQDTVKRLLTGEPRRIRALGAKAAVGASALSAVLGAGAGVGWVASRLVGSKNDVVVEWEGRTLLAAGVTALVGAAVAFAISAITRSDAFAMVGAFTVILILDPLLSLIPRFGKYSFGTGLESISDAIAGDSILSPDSVSTFAGVTTIAVWLGVLLGLGATLFATRDV